MIFAIEDAYCSPEGRICNIFAIEDRYLEAYGLLSVQIWLLRGAIKSRLWRQNLLLVATGDLMVNFLLFIISSVLWAQINILATVVRQL